jgi:hypothetical protein
MTMTHTDAEPIVFEEFTSNDMLVRLTVTPDGESCLACETDTGPLRQVAVYGDRDLLLWMADVAERALVTLHRRGF